MFPEKTFLGICLSLLFAATSFAQPSADVQTDNVRKHLGGTWKWIETTYTTIRNGTFSIKQPPKEDPFTVTFMEDGRAFVYRHHKLANKVNYELSREGSVIIFSNWNSEANKIDEGMVGFENATLFINRDNEAIWKFERVYESIKEVKVEEKVEVLTKSEEVVLPLKEPISTPKPAPKPKKKKRR
jgi:hypothetical protein